MLVDDLLFTDLDTPTTLRHSQNNRPTGHRYYKGSKERPMECTRSTWAKTKLQNVESGLPPSTVMVSVVGCWGLRQINISRIGCGMNTGAFGITSSTLGQRDRMWLTHNLPLAKIRINTTLVLLCGWEPQTILKEDNRRLEAFHVRCQYRILSIKWSDFITYNYVFSRPATELPDSCDTIVYNRHILSGTLGTLWKTWPWRSPSNYASMPARERN